MCRTMLRLFPKVGRVWVPSTPWPYHASRKLKENDLPSRASGSLCHGATAAAIQFAS